MPIYASNIQRGLAHARTEGLMPLFRRHAQRAGVPLANLLAVASQETRMGRNIPGGDGKKWDNGGYAWGVMQINDRYNDIARTATDGNDHGPIIAYGADLLAKEYRTGGTWWDAFRRYNSGGACEAVQGGNQRRRDACRAGRAYADETAERADLIRQQLAPTDSTYFPTGTDTMKNDQPFDNFDLYGPQTVGTPTFNSDAWFREIGLPINADGSSSGASTTPNPDVPLYEPDVGLIPEPAPLFEKKYSTDETPVFSEDNLLTVTQHQNDAQQSAGVPWRWIAGGAVALGMAAILTRD